MSEDPGRRGAGELLRRTGTAGAFVLLCAVFSVLAPSAFASSANLANLLQQTATLAIAAAGATVVMTVAEFDLSLGAVASLAGVLCLALLGRGAGPAPAVAAALLAGLAAGLANGVLVARLGAPSFVATLGTGTIVGGLAYWVSGGASLFRNVPAAFTTLARGDIAGVPVLAWWMAGIGGLLAVTLATTRFGRHLQAVGGNAEAARLVGLPVARLRLAAFALSGALAALAGVLLAARLGSAQHTMGDALLLPAYAAVFLGATASPAGLPSIGGTLLGVAIAAVIANGLTILGTEPFVQRVATGIIIVAAVLAQRVGRA